MTDDRLKTAEDQLMDLYGEVENQFYRLFSPSNQEKFMSAVGSVAQFGKESLEFALQLISELSTELTGVKSFKVIPKPPAELNVEIKFKKENNVKFKHMIAPMVELESVQFGKEISFGAEIEKEEKGLRINITEGFAIVMNLGPLIGKHSVNVKGSGLLKRDENKEIVLITQVEVPGVEQPIDVVIPLKLIFHKLGKKI